VDIEYASVACSVSDEQMRSGSGGLVNLLTREEKEQIIDRRVRRGLGSRLGGFCRGCLPGGPESIPEHVYVNLCDCGSRCGGWGRGSGLAGTQ
jgi:hypothetical protein